jgi:hypothetical protein
MAPQHKQQQGQRSWMLPQRHTPHPQRLSSASASTAGAASEPPPPPKPEDIVDLPAKLTLLEEAGIAGSREELFRRFSPFLCSPAHHISTRLAFLRSRGKLTDPPRLWKVGGRGCRLWLRLCSSSSFCSARCLWEDAGRAGWLRHPLLPPPCMLPCQRHCRPKHGYLSEK